MWKVIVGIIVVIILVALGIIISRIGEEGSEYIKNRVSMPDEARRTLAPPMVNRMVELFEAKHGRLPETLQELKKSEGRLPRLPKGEEYKYDPETGKISIVKINPVR